MSRSLFLSRAGRFLPHFAQGRFLLAYFWLGLRPAIVAVVIVAACLTVLVLWICVTVAPLRGAPTEEALG